MDLEDKLIIAINAATRKITGDKNPVVLPVKHDKHADISISCHNLANRLGMAPSDLADSIISNLNCKKMFDLDNLSSIKNLGGYININYDPKILAEQVLTEVLTFQDNYGKNSEGFGKFVVIDYSAPNIGKPLHVGHIRSTIIGDSITRLLNFSGFKTYGINYLGDSGLHIGKLITAYSLWGKKENLKNEPEKELLNLYVRFGKESEHDESLEIKAKEVVKNLENGDNQYTQILSIINCASMKTFDKVYNLLDINFDETTGQSFFSNKGKGIVNDLIKQGKADYSAIVKNIQDFSMEENESNGVIVSLDEFNLPAKVILRSDGTAIYSTQDIGAAVDRFEKHKFDKMIYVVANEQELYFKQLFKILEKGGFEFADKCHHLGFGLIHLQEGRMSTREGNVVFLEDVLEKAVGLAKERLKTREFDEKSEDIIATQIGIGAVKYSVLQVDPVKDISFSWDKFMDFEGNSAVYLQYAYARATRIIDQSKKGINHFKPEHLTSVYEQNLIKTIAKFPEQVRLATEKMKPNLICNYAFSLAKDFNEFYKNVRVFGETEEQSRLVLVEATRYVLNNSAKLLGIGLPDKM